MMITPYNSTDRLLQIRFNNTLESHHFNHANSKIFIRPNYPEFGSEVRSINKIIQELSDFNASIINQYIFSYQTNFSARFDKQDEDNQVLDVKINYSII